MRKGIHRGYKLNADEEPKRAWVAEVAGGAGEWLSEAEYRAGGYSPDFDRLPVLVTEILGHGPVDVDALPPEEREYLRKYFERPSVIEARLKTIYHPNGGHRVVIVRRADGIYGYIEEEHHSDHPLGAGWYAMSAYWPDRIEALCGSEEIAEREALARIDWLRQRDSD
jgi:hypothetical protein